MFLVAACDSGPKDTADPPTGPQDLVLRMVELPGLLPPGGGLTLPGVSVFGSGLAIVNTPAGLVKRWLTDAGVRKVSQAAADAGLAGQADIGNPDGIDVGSVTFVVVSGGQRHVNLVVSPKGEIRALVDHLRNLDGFLGSDVAPETAPYEPSRLAVWAQPQETSASPRSWQLNRPMLPDETTCPRVESLAVS